MKRRAAFGIGAGSMGQGGAAAPPGIFFAPSGPSWPPLALGSNYLYLNKIIAKTCI